MSLHFSTEKTVGHMSCQLSIITNQIIACSNPGGKINLIAWSRLQKVDAKVLFDVVCNHVLEHQTLKILKHLQRKALA